MYLPCRHPGVRSHHDAPIKLHRHDGCLQRHRGGTIRAGRALIPSCGGIPSFLRKQPQERGDVWLKVTRSLRPEGTSSIGFFFPPSFHFLSCLSWLQGKVRAWPWYHTEGRASLSPNLPKWSSLHRKERDRVRCLEAEGLLLIKGWGRALPSTQRQLCK